MDLLPNKKRRRRFLARIDLIIIFSLLLLVIFSFSLVGEIVNRHQVSRQVDDLQQQIGRLERDNSEISNLIDSWQASDNLERQARLKFGLQKPGEELVLIRRSNEVSAGGQSTPASEGQNQVVGNAIVAAPDETPNIIKWWRYFFPPK